MILAEGWGGGGTLRALTTKLFQEDLPKNVGKYQYIP